MTFTEQDLLDRGFVDTSWMDSEDNLFTEFSIDDDKTGISLQVSGINLIELVIHDEVVTLQIDTLPELDTVIKVWGLNKK